MLCMELLIPVSMIGLGKYFTKKAPKEINMLFGYRTPMSTKNKETWEFAHNYFGKIWYICGWPLLVVSVAVMVLVIGKGDDYVGTVGGILGIFQMIPLCGAIVPTEIALKKHFDKDGKRKNIG